MTEETKHGLVGTVVLAGIVIMIFWFGWGFGDLHGYDRAIEDDKKITCQIENNYKPYKDVEAECLKYFEPQK
jgi:hypothetical protein